MSSLAEIEQALRARDPEERRQAIRRLANYPVQDAVYGIGVALADRDWRVRKEAVAAAVGLAPSPVLLQSLVTLLGDGENDIGLRNAVVEALAGFGASCVDALTEALPSLDADSRKLAAEALGQCGHEGALAALEELVNDPDSNVRATALEQVAGLGSASLERVVPILERHLEHSDTLLRLTALRGLNELGVATPWLRIQSLIQDPMLKGAAMVAAARSQAIDAGKPLVSLLANAGAGSRRQALHAVAEYVQSSSACAEAARQGLAELDEAQRSGLVRLALPEHSNLAERRDAILLLGVMGCVEAAQLAVRSLADERVASEAASAIGLLGERAIEALLDAEHFADPTSLASCLELLGQLKSSSSTRHVAALALRQLKSSSPEVVSAALGTLAAVGDANALEPVSPLLFSADARLRRAATETLEVMTRRHPEAAQAIAWKARPDTEDALPAAIIMATLGRPIRSAAEDVEFLSLALTSSHPQIRRASVEALARFGSDAAVEAVAFLLTDEEPNVSAAALRALGRMRRADDTAAGLIPLLELVRRGGAEEIMAAVASALGDTGDPRAQTVLCELVATGSPRVAVSAVEALASFRGPSRNSALFVALHHPDPEVVKAAMPRLADDPDSMVCSHLTALLVHSAWDVRRLAADLLGRVGGESTLRHLRRRMALEPEELVREALQRALLELENQSSCIRRTTPPPIRGSARER